MFFGKIFQVGGYHIFVTRCPADFLIKKNTKNSILLIQKESGKNNFFILISDGHLNTCARFQRNTRCKTYFLTNGIFRHWSTNLTIDDVITQERATVFS